MTTEKTATGKSATPVVSGVPPLPEDVGDVKPGPGQRAVTSPAGTRSVVDERDALALRLQGYKIEGGHQLDESADRPAKTASKDAWFEYAVAQGVPSFEAANMSKDDLIKRMEG